METCHFLFQAPARMCRLPLPLPWGASVIAIISAHLATAACLAPSEPSVYALVLMRRLILLLHWVLLADWETRRTASDAQQAHS